MSKLIIAEKPSVAKSIASALGASSRADGFYEGNGLLVSWCVGHLVSPMDAGSYDERFKKWRYDDLPILPEPFRYVLAPGKEDAFENLRALMDRPDVDMLLPPELLKAIDPVPFGKYAMQEEQGHFTEHGYISLSGDEWNHERPAEPEKKPSIRERLEQGKKECAEKNKVQPHKEKSAPEL